MEFPNCTAVLVVEDEDDIRDEVVACLRSEGFQVYEAENERQALAVLSTMPQPGLVLIDLLMPSISGPSLIGALRNGDRAVTLPMVAVSTFATSAGGPYRHQKKPIDLR